MKMTNFTKMLLLVLSGLLGGLTTQAQDIFMSNATINNACGRNFFDSGGAGGNYADGNSGTQTLTLCPADINQAIKVNFTKFDVAPGDRLMAYAGKTVNANRVIGLDGNGDDVSDIISSSALPSSGAGAGIGASVSNSPGGGWLQVPSFCDNPDFAGCVTFRFTTNGDNVKGAGWEAQISCPVVAQSTVIDCRNNQFVNDIFIDEDCDRTEVQIPVPKFEICGNAIEATYSVDCNEVSGFGGTVTANGNGYITGNFPTGNFTVTVQGNPPAGVDASDFVCTYSFRVFPTGLGCNDLVRVSLGTGCTSTITPDLILEDPCEDASYEVVLPEAATNDPVVAAAQNLPLVVGETPSGFPIVDFSNVHCDTEYDVTIRRTVEVACGQDMVDICWGKIRIEDKIDPIFVDGPDVTAIYCYDKENILSKLNARRSNGTRVVGITGGTITGDVSGETYTIPGLTPEGDGLFEEVAENCSYEVTVSSWTSTPADCSLDNLGPYQCWNLDQLVLVNSISSIFTFYERTFTATDKCGNTDTYRQLVALVQPDIVAPVPQFKVDCDVDINPRELRQSWLDWVAEGKPAGDPRQFYASFIPNFDETHLDLPSAISYYGITLPPSAEGIVTDGSGDEIPADIEHAECGYVIDWQDGNVIETCGGGFKLFRDWTIYNWCDGHLELIDIIPQVIIAEPSTPRLESDLVHQVGGGGYYDCSANVTFQRPDVSGACVGFENSVQVTLEVNGERKTFNGTNPLTFNNVDIGQTTTVIIFASNGCQSLTEIGRKTITIVDNIPPVPVCERNHVVSLGLDCIAQVQAEVFDDGSYDNCGVINFKVARMDELANTENLASAANEDIFGEYVTFTSDDLTDCETNSTTIVLQVKDGRGNVNFCMVQTTVQDKIAPVCESQDFAFNCPDAIVDDLIAAKRSDNRTRALADLLFDGSLGGVPAAFDNCSEATIEVTNADFRFFDETCREGYITYEYRAVDQCGNRSPQCTGRIDVDPVINWAMTFPRDYEIDCTEGSGIELPPAATLSDILTNNGCDSWALEVQEYPFYAVADACYKIVREYNLINWCTWNPSNTEDAVVERPEDLILQDNRRVNLRYRDNNNNGVNDIDDDDDGDAYDVTDLIFDGDFVVVDFNDSPYGAVETYVEVSQFTGVVETYLSAQHYGNILYRQIIKVNDFTAPEITAGEESEFCGGGIEPTPGNPCTAEVDLRFNATDACTPADLLTVTYRLRPFGGTAVSDGFGQLVNLGDNEYAIRGNYPIGPEGTAEHIVVVTVEDGCGNTEVVEIPFTVKDCKAPTAYCKFGVSVDLMVDGTVELWATDFDAGSTDFCTPRDELTFTFADPTLYPDSVNRIFRCADDEIGTVPVDLFVQDKAGNVSFCQTFVNVQPNQPGTDCPDNGTATVAGAIQTEMTEPVQDVEMYLSGSMETMVTTSATGEYSLNELTLGNDYTVTPKKNNDLKNGVSTFDLVLISKHILDVEYLDSPYKMIAADVDNNKRISTFDMVLLRKVILELETSLENNQSWRFISRDYEFPNPNDPWADEFPEVVNINNLSQSAMQADFMAIKVGDVNYSAETNNLLGTEGRTTAGEMLLQVEDQRVAFGKTYEVAFTAADLDRIDGTQFTLNFNRNALELVDVEEGVLTTNHFNLTRAAEGTLTASWNGKANADDVLFTLVFLAKADAQLSELLSLSSEYLLAEAYTESGDLLDVALSFDESTVKATGFELYQNQPNPFKGETLIGFHLPKGSSATLTVHDISGKVLKLIRGDFAKGYNQITLNSRELPQAGVLYYSLSTDGHHATKKMIIIE